MNTFSLSENSRSAFNIAQSIAKENHSHHYGGVHLFKALLHNEIGLSSQLVSFGKDVNYLNDWVEYRIEQLPKNGRPASEINKNKEIDKILEVSDLVRLKLGHELVEPMSLLISLLRTGIVFSDDQLKSIPLSEQELLQYYLEDREIGISNTSQGDSNNKKEQKNADALLKYCHDLTLSAKEGKIDEVIGREAELRSLKEIIGRRTKPNVIIVGEPGVGKTSLIEGFALDLSKDNVPDFLKGALLYELDLGSLIAGASYKGEVEDRLKKIIGSLKSSDNIILFIDEIHALLDPKSGFGGAANLLKPELAKGEITVIGATTNEEYRKYIESDEAFNRRFDLVRVEEPDFQTAYQMLKKVIPYYEKHHDIVVEDLAIRDAIRLCQRYLKERKLPDSSIDLLDQTMAAFKMMKESTELLLSQFNDELTSFDSEPTFEEIKWIGRNINSSFSPILLGKLKEDLELNEKDSINHSVELIQKYLDDIKTVYTNSESTITSEEIGAMVSQKTNIPLGKLQSDEQQKLLDLEQILQKRVVGQDHAIHIIAESVRESRAGLLKAGQPVGSFFFMGPTGTGKTELAKTLADFLFNDERALIRFDMSEFKEEHSVALLYGAPPGYVGYEEGGMLVNKIRQQPYSIVLFDEIEKAHQSVFDLFLQILDEGKLSDRLGKIGDFSNAIILFTSNIGSDFIIEKFNNKEIPDSTVLMEKMSNYFRPEFLARLTEIVPFAPISSDILVKIFDIHIKQLIKILAKKEIELTISDEAKFRIATEDFDQRYGARPIKGRIRNFIRRPFSKKIISGEVTNESSVHLELDKDNEIVWIIN